MTKSIIITKLTTTLLDNTNAHLHDIAISLSKTNPWPIYSALISMFAVMAALYASNKEFIHGALFKPRMQIKEFRTLQQGNLLITRLEIVNTRQQTARNVSIWVDELSYFSNNQWSRAANFLHFPLAWTHWSDSKSGNKDLHHDRPYLIDVCQVIIGNPPQAHELHLCTLFCDVRGPSTHMLSDLTTGKNKIRVSIYCDNHKIERYFIEIDWLGTDKAPTFNLSKA